MMQERQRLKIPDSKLESGSLTGKHPVVLDDGKTTIFISDKSKEMETRERYKLRMTNRFMCFYKKPKA
jgi:hypothetical protein